MQAPLFLLSFCPPLAELYLIEQNLNPSAVFKLPFKITIENKLRSFQFKLIHNIIPTNQRLWNMNIKVSLQCEQCNFPTKTTIHMFFECPAVKLLWKDVLNWWNFKHSESINPSATEILYSYKPESKSFHTYNHYLLIARYYIYLARNKSNIPKLEVLIIFLETKIQCEREIATKNGNLIKRNRNKWTSLCISDMCCDSSINLGNLQFFWVFFFFSFIWLLFFFFVLIIRSILLY